jgi:hypothetical protein
MRAHKTLADKYKQRLIAYEAGQHAVGVGGGENNDRLTALLLAANRHERMGRLYTRYLNAWRDTAGGDLCCLFSSTGTWSKWGSWGLLEHNGDDTPKYQAVLRWNAANPALPTRRRAPAQGMARAWHVHENYSADTGEGCDKSNSDRFYHWGGLLGLIALIEAGHLGGPERPLTASADKESNEIP